MKYVVYLWAVLANPEGELISVSMVPDQVFYGDTQEQAVAVCKKYGATETGEFLEKIFEEQAIQGIVHFACEPRRIGVDVSGLGAPGVSL